MDQLTTTATKPTIPPTKTTTTKLQQNCNNNTTNCNKQKCNINLRRRCTILQFQQLQSWYCNITKFVLFSAFYGCGN